MFDPINSIPILACDNFYPVQCIKYYKNYICSDILNEIIVKFIVLVMVWLVKFTISLIMVFSRISFACADVYSFLL